MEAKMISKLINGLVMMLLATLLAACGTIEVSLADEISVVELGDVSGEPTDEATGGPESTAAPPATATIAIATQTRPAEPTATPEPTEVVPEETVAPTAVPQTAPAGWLQFYDDEYGLELWHPPGTIVIVEEPASPVFWSVEFPDEIVEEQVFVVRVVQEEGGALGPPGPHAILNVKLVANPDGKNIGQVAELFSRRCSSGPPSSIQPTTINVQLSGYRYSCVGIDEMILNEFWSPHTEDPQLSFGAAWWDMSAPLSDEILATVSLER
jgi:hypothetical protein